MSSTTEEIPVLKLTRTYPVPRERVFAAWTEPTQIRQWFGPQGCQIADIQADFRVGGKYRFAIISEQYGPMTVSGTYREITPPSKLAYTWAWEDDEAYKNHDTLVTVEFIDCNGATEVRLTHENFPSAQSAGNHEYGWTGAFDNLAKLLNS